LPVAPLAMTAETLLIPNTVAVVRGAPDPGPAQQLFEYLQSREVVDRLVVAKAIEGAFVNAVTTPTLQVDWSRVLNDAKRTTAQLNEIFLR